MWLGTARRERFLKMYRTTPKVHYIYFLIVSQDNMIKIGRTSRLIYRLRNLRAGIYQEHEIKTIVCIDGNETKAVESHLKKKFSHQNVAGEWFKLNYETIVSEIDKQFPHLLITEYDEAQKPLYKRVPDISVPEFNISLI